MGKGLQEIGFEVGEGERDVFGRDEREIWSIENGRSSTELLGIVYLMHF